MAFEGAQHAKLYAKSRPSYPQSLVDAIIGYLGDMIDRDLAIDVGCGNGQATNLFARYFKQVNGYDQSVNQIKEATTSAENVRFFVSPSESIAMLDAGSVSLITVAAAIHWFNLEAFFNECDRLLKPNGGVLAIFSYFMATIRTQSEAVNEKFQEKVEFLRPYFPKGFEIAQNGYADIRPPFRDVKRERVSNELRWKLDDIINLIASFSGYQQYNSQYPGNRFLDEAREEFKQLLSSESEEISIFFDIALILCRK